MVCVRISKGSFYKDFYYFISKPFWPGHFQKEVILKSIDQESLITLNLIKKDNIRLRKILSLQESSNNFNISAASKNKADIKLTNGEKFKFLNDRSPNQRTKIIYPKTQ